MWRGDAAGLGNHARPARPRGRFRFCWVPRMRGFLRRSILRRFRARFVRLRRGFRPSSRVGAGRPATALGGLCVVWEHARGKGMVSQHQTASLGDGLLRPREEKDLATKLRTRIPRVTAACVVRRRGEFGGNRGGRRARWVWRTNNPNGRVPWDRLHLRGPANYHPPPRFQASPQDRPRLAAAC